MSLIKRIKEHSFEVKHIIVLFVILVIFQVVLIYLNKFSTNNLINKTMNLYKKDSAERIANLTTTSLELLVEQSLLYPTHSEPAKRKIIQAFNIIFSQQTLQRNVDELCIIVSSQGQTFAIDDGKDLVNLFFDNRIKQLDYQSHQVAVNRYATIQNKIMHQEEIYSFFDGKRSFHIFVPFVPKGEFQGVVYTKITPDLSNITRQISTAYNEISVVFIALILFGLLAMFYVTSYTVEDRDQTKELLFQEREHQLKLEIAHQKEALFTKRIYHAHHKAEKIMGFIKEEVNALTANNIKRFKYIVTKYANFISRVIYDMKWYNPPIHATRNPMFHTDVNEVLKFLVNHVFERVHTKHGNYQFEFDLDENLPVVSINEYVVWEILEPLIQNSIDHNREQNITILLKTRYYPENHFGEVIIEDNGQGIPPKLIETDYNGIKKIFLEHTSTKRDELNSGYGCYLAYEISRNRCGWQMNAENIEQGDQGCRIRIKIPLTNKEV